MYKPDLRLGFGNRQVDGFDFARERTSWCICEEVVLLILPLSRKRRKQCRECRECSPIGKVPAEFSVESFQKGLHSLHCLHSYLSSLTRKGINKGQLPRWSSITSRSHTLLSRNRQHSLSQPHTASLRTPATNPGQAHIRHP